MRNEVVNYENARQRKIWNRRHYCRNNREIGGHTDQPTNQPINQSHGHDKVNKLQ